MDMRHSIAHCTLSFSLSLSLSWDTGNAICRYLMLCNNKPSQFSSHSTKADRHIMMVIIWYHIEFVMFNLHWNCLILINHYNIWIIEAWYCRKSCRRNNSNLLDTESTSFKDPDESEYFHALTVNCQKLEIWLNFKKFEKIT